MKDAAEFSITREKHLDHMVRVVPLIVMAYAIQCYFIMQLGPDSFATDGLVFMGGCLMAMISCFITYDLTHSVNFKHEFLTIKIKWLGHEKNLNYQDITSIEIAEAQASFSTLKLTTRDGKKYRFYFIDEADKVKAWIEKKRTPELQTAA